MAIMPMKVMVGLTDVEYRPCMVTEYSRKHGPEERKALFHKWTVEAEVLEPSRLKGGHSGGQLRATLAIVEMEDGTVRKCNPADIRFIDTKEAMGQLAWGEDEA